MDQQLRQGSQRWKDQHWIPAYSVQLKTTDLPTHASVSEPRGHPLQFSPDSPQIKLLLSSIHKEPDWYPVETIPMIGPGRAGKAGHLSAARERVLYALCLLFEFRLEQNFQGCRPGPVCPCRI